MEELQAQIDLLKEGKTLLYPSDTIWGIGGDATNEAVCQKIKEIKKRPAENSFIVLMDSWKMVEKYVPDFHEVCYELADLADKPLTIIYPSARNLAPSALAADGSVGIRITKDPICLRLIRGLRAPLISTSANLSGQPSPQYYKDIETSIKNGVDGIVKARMEEKMTTPSQIIKVELDGRVKVVRK